MVVDVQLRIFSDEDTTDMRRSNGRGLLAVAGTSSCLTLLLDVRIGTATHVQRLAHRLPASSEASLRESAQR